MHRRTLVRRTAVALAGLAAAIAGPVVPAAQAEASAIQPATTAVTFLAPGCNGCRLTLMKATRDGELWSSKTKSVSDGTVTFHVSREHTHGMSVAIRTPWEGNTGYVTHVAFKYSGQEPGDRVSFTEAQHSRKGSACWAGTREDEATIRLATRRVTVSGYHGPRTPAALVYTPVTQHAMVPMLQTFHGIVGSQDIPLCGPR